MHYTEIILEPFLHAFTTQKQTVMLFNVQFNSVNERTIIVCLTHTHKRIATPVVDLFIFELSFLLQLD